MPGYPTELDVDSLTLKTKWTLDKVSGVSMTS